MIGLRSGTSEPECDPACVNDATPFGIHAWTCGRSNAAAAACSQLCHPGHGSHPDAARQCLYAAGQRA